MLRHIFLVAIRNAYKHLNYALINILGLALGLASFIFIIIYVSDELKYDKFHTNADKTYRVNRLYNANDVNEDAATLSFPEGEALQNTYPDMIKTMCRLFDLQVSTLLFEYVKNEDDIVKFNEDWFYMADSTVFDVFTFSFVEGDIETALDRPGVVVISETTAKRYFGKEPAMGKILRIEEGPNVEVTGVFKDLPSQSHLRIDILGSLSTFRQFAGGQLPRTWIWNPCWTYIVLQDNVKPESLEANFPEFIKNNYLDFKDQKITLTLQPLTDIHLKSQHEYEMHPNSDIIYVKILTGVAIFVLLLACINFMNLATASSAGRAKEIGLKKVLGAGRRQLTIQFLFEATLHTFMAFIIAASAVEFLLTAFNNFTGKNIDGGIFLQGQNILFAAGLVIIVGLISGSYPAFFLSSLDTSRLRGNLVQGAKSGIARKILVVFQFSISIALIIGTFSVYSQLNYMRNASLGFKKDHIIILPAVRNLSVNFDRFAEELKTNKDILYVTGMEDILGVNHNTRPFFIEGHDEANFYYYPAFVVRDEFLETFDIKVVAGRGFSSDYPDDTLSAIMINETMVKNLGWTNEEAIGKRVRSDGQEKIIGVFQDFNALSLHAPIRDFVIDEMGNPRGAAGLTRYIAIRVNTDNYKELLKFIKKSWEDIAPTRPFEYFFFEDKLDTLYKNEDKFSKISLLLTLLAMIIASMGLIGLTSFLVEKKTKEICIRRVHGAKVANINGLLSREFIKLILIANLISWPAAYFWLNSWLDNFTQHVMPQWYVFVISGIVTLVVALLITVAHAIRASLMNPAITLKYE
jgi:putative ABC transport system permease protein